MKLVGRTDEVSPYRGHGHHHGRNNNDDQLEENNGHFSVVNTDPYTSLLKIDKVNEFHTGEYFCDASSSAGRVFRSHNLTVFGI